MGWFSCIQSLQSLLPFNWLQERQAVTQFEAVVGPPLH